MSCSLTKTTFFLVNIRIVLLVTLFMAGLSCGRSGMGFTWDIEKRRAEGKSITVPYSYNWEKVFGAVEYVLVYSDNSLLKRFSESSRLEKTEKDEKAIWFSPSWAGTSGRYWLVLFFVPKGDSSTVMEIVWGMFFGTDKEEETIVKTLVDDTQFYLKYGAAEYREYTRKKNQDW